eukprot:TRINITY_DN730_c0_g1_i2.p1 TRINITY_DN730_c0_g1~~TRINITY_DN730_c0_g1_i2.p1  ORF type:complete len:592 (-),score=120.57 TRINITY_DN730_c0_g1_i2:10-1785(-)
MDSDDEYELLMEADSDVKVDDREFIILSRSDLLQTQKEEIGKVAELLGVEDAYIRILLMHFDWDSEKLLTIFFDRGKEAVYKSAGVRDPEETSLQTGECTCPICYDDGDASTFTKLNCGHQFCNECWTRHVSLKINEGQSRRIHCMSPKCNVVLDETLVPKFIDKQSHARYVNSLLDSYVEDNAYLTWCPSVPHCGNAAKIFSGTGGTVQIRCKCGNFFCFGCGEEAHTPCSCKQKKTWNQKLADDSENCNYLHANTKDCPKCGKAIEKDGGCNLVTCTCGQHMCWLCGAPTGQAHTWEKIEGHSCGKWKGETTTSPDKSRSALARFVHYYDRWKANDDTKKLKEKMVEDMMVKAEILKEESAFDVQWLHRALYQLFECRRILAYSYVFGFCMFDEEREMSAAEQKRNLLHKNLFEDFQEQLAVTTEKLSKYLEMTIADTTPHVFQEIINLTILNDRRCKALVDTIKNDILGEGAYGFGVASYQLNTEGSSTWTTSHSTHYFEAMVQAKKRQMEKEKEEARQEREKQRAKKAKEDQNEVEDAIRRSLMDVGGKVDHDADMERAIMESLGYGGNQDDDEDMQKALLMSQQYK